MYIKENYFENHYARDQVFYDEYLFYFFFKRPLLLVSHIALLVYFLFGCFLYLFPGNDTLKLFLIGVPLIVWGIIGIQYIRAKKRHMKLDLELNNGKLGCYTFIITEEKIKCYGENQEVTQEIDLAKIRKVIQTKHFDILLTKAKLAIPLKKDSYRKGSSLELLRFLKTKGIG